MNDGFHLTHLTEPNTNWAFHIPHCMPMIHVDYSRTIIWPKEYIKNCMHINMRKHFLHYTGYWKTKKNCNSMKCSIIHNKNHHPAEYSNHNLSWDNAASISCPSFKCVCVCGTAINYRHGSVSLYIRSTLSFNIFSWSETQLMIAFNTQIIIIRKLQFYNI